MAPNGTSRRPPLGVIGGAVVFAASLLTSKSRPSPSPSAGAGVANGDVVNSVVSGGDHGRGADSPRDIPKAGWRDVLARVIVEVREDQVSALAGGVAFFAMLAIFPALSGVTSIYGLVADPNQVASQLDGITDALPREAADLLVTQVETIAGSGRGSLSLGVVISLLLLIWSASSGMQGLLRALGRTYDQPETRTPVRLRLLALTMTVGALLLAAVAIGLIVALPAVLDAVGMGRAGEITALVVRWPALAVLLSAGLAVVYRYGADRAVAKWRWVTPGALVALVLWLAGSVGFSIYTSSLGTYNETYGALGAVVVLMLWLYLSAFVILLGAEINAEVEHQTAVDSTVGPVQPMGQRGAVMADEIGATAGQVKQVKQAERAARKHHKDRTANA